MVEERKDKMAYLHIISGSMYSSKTTRLIELYNNLKDSKNVIIFNHSIDTRYNGTNYITSHDRNSIQCTSISSILDIYEHPQYKQTDVIMIDECQFFSSLKNVLDMIHNDNKHIILSGLMLDKDCQYFGELYLLIPYADVYEQKYSRCFQCNQNGLFTIKINQSFNPVIDVGSVDKYLPVCRYHYLNK